MRFGSAIPLSLDEDFAFVVPSEIGHAPDERRFARAILTNEGQSLARHDRKVLDFQAEVAVSLSQMTNLKGFHRL
jgi:hypothetical protein